MGLLWNVMLGGMTYQVNTSWRERTVYGFGRWLANRRRGVHIDPTCLVHPDAWVCARGQTLRVGARSKVALGVMLQGFVTIGDDSTVQANGCIVGYRDGEVRIGNHVRIAANCMIIGANHEFSDPDRPIHGQGVTGAPITIEDDVWIGGRVNITAGVTIGTGSVIGAGAVVTKDIPPKSIAVGVPARVVKERN